MAKRFQFRHVNELTGLFVLLILVGAIVALVAAARSQRWFAATIEYKLKLPDSGASGLRPGNEVILLGLPAGIVKDVNVTETGHLDARISLRKDLAQFIRSDSYAEIKKIYGVAGDSYVEIAAGTNGVPLAEGASIRCLSSDEFKSLVERVYGEVRAEILPVVRKASGLLDEWGRLGTNLNSSQAELHQMLAKLNRLTENLAEGKGSAGRFLTDTNFITQGERMLVESRQAVAELQTVLQQVKEGTVHLPEVAENLREGTARFPAIAQAVESETRDLPGLVWQVQQTASELQRLTEAMQRHWLLRKYVEPRESGGRIPPENISGGTP